jgi:hypothetical protein
MMFGDFFCSNTVLSTSTSTDNNEAAAAAASSNNNNDNVATTTATSVDRPAPTRVPLRQSSFLQPTSSLVTPRRTTTTNESSHQEKEQQESATATITTSRFSDRMSTVRRGDGPVDLDEMEDRMSTVDELESQRLDLSKRYLTNDTFSFLVSSSKTLSSPVLFAIVVFIIQVAVFTLVAIDITDLENTGNILNIPHNVEAPVRVTEVLALIIAVLTQDDIRTSMNLLRDGYRPSYFEEFEGATKTKWAMSIVLRALEGLLGLFVTFLLVMQSENVLDLLLNFSAMEFVSLLDEAGFTLIKQGLVGSEMRKAAKRVSRTYYHVPHGKHKAWSSAAFLILLMGAMIGAWGAIYSRQLQGDFVCDRIFVQLDDGFVPTLGAFSGLYNVNKDRVIHGRVTYESSLEGDPSIIGYCSEEGAWTFAIRSDQDDDGETDPCDWVATSSESSSFDVASTASLQWFVKTTESRIVPMESYQVQCYDCENVNDFCGKHGVCENNACVCYDERYGLRCEFQAPCSSLAIDERNLGFVSSRTFGREYTQLEDFQVYNRPVYTSPISLEDEEESDDIIDIMIFTGNRWVLTSTSALKSFDASANVIAQLESYFETFHAYYSNYTVSFISEAVYIDSTTDIRASPLGLVWYHATAMDQGPSDTMAGIPAPDTRREQIEPNLLCAICDQVQNPCLFDAICKDIGTCGCTQGSTGRLCQIPPLSNGRCDEFFNRAEFGFDGGDCCGSTCRSTPESTCGKDDTGFIDIGYRSCQEDPINTWLPSGLSIPAITSSAQSGMSVALGGMNGSILAVADPGANTVRLFDQVGSEWIQRGQSIEGPPNSQFGLSISLAGESTTVVKNPFTSPTITLAVTGIGVARIYSCETQGCVQIGDQLTGAFGRSIELSRDGNVVVIGGEPLSSNEDSPQVYTRGSDGWFPRGNFTDPNLFFRAISQYTKNGYYVSISGDGDVVAVGSLLGLVEPGPVFVDMALLVQTYRWNGSDWGIWGGEIGDRSVDHFLNDSTRGEIPLRSVVLSADGLVLAIGRKEHVVVYMWDEKVTDWVSRGSPIVNENPEDLAGWSVDLNGDGTVLVIGTGEDNASTLGSSIRVFTWNGTDYEPLLNELPGGTTSAVALSNDGKAVAVGLPFSRTSGNIGGSTIVYKYLPPPKCDENSQLLRLSITTDRNPQETYWELNLSTGEKISSPSYDDQFATFVEEACVPIDGWATFIVYDISGDGMEVPGRYELFLDGELVGTGGSFEYVEKTQIGTRVCPEGTSLLTLQATSNFFNVIWEVADKSGQAIISGGLNCPTYSGANSYCTNLVEECVPTDCATVSISDSVIFAGNGGCNAALTGDILYEITIEGLGSVSFQNDRSGEFCGNSIRFGECPSIPDIKCEEGTVPARIEISRFGYLEGLNWTVADICSPDVDTFSNIVFEGELLSGGFDPSSLLGALAISSVDVVEQTCLPEGACYLFQGVLSNDHFFNDFGISEVEYSLFYNGVEGNFIQTSGTGTVTIGLLVDDCDCIAE